MGIEIRPIEPDEFEAFRHTLAMAFHFDPTEESSLARRLEYDRTVAAYDGDALVGTGGAFSLKLTVPGGAQVATGGTTVVSVRPTHRRQGLLRSMMQAHFDDVAAREELLAALWASDSGIYGRFGYGPATQRLELDVDKHHAEFADEPPPGRVDFVPVDDVLSALQTVYDRVVSERAGMFTRSEEWWRTTILDDPEERRNGWSAARYAVYTEDGAPQGYVKYRAKENWERGHGAGKVGISELIAATTPATAGLWRLLCGLDLVAELKHWNAPVDEILPWLLVNPRRVQAEVTDALWVRLMDVPAALAARRYRVPGRLVIEVVDAALPDVGGVFELHGGPDGAECKPSDAEPELRLDAMALGAAYLGGTRLTTLARAGHVAAAPDVVERADLLFSWPEAPWCQEVF